jgi:ABC-2 type transport system permease protein
MNTPAAVSTRAQEPGWAAAWAQHPQVRTFRTLARREFWEHRSLWLAPAIVSGLLLACALLTHGAAKIDANDASEWLDPQVKSNLFALAQWGLTIPQYLVMLVLQTFYLLDCLYSERKDRSILFWKSLPVSDAMTVLSKFFVGAVVLPLGTFVLALVTDVLFTVIWDLRAFVGGARELIVWDTLAFAKTHALMFLGLIVSMLWYAPFLGAFLLASAVVRRNVLMWVTLVPLVAVIVEKISFGSHWLQSFLDYRIFGIWGDLHVESAILGSMTPVGGNEFVSIPELFDRVHVLPAFRDIDLWLGLLFTAGCLFAAARVRRYRDDT